MERHTLLLIVLLFSATLAQAQRFPEHSVSTGILLGAGSFNSTFPVTFGYGIKADYQRNMAPWFSLRLETAYTANTKATEYRTYNLGEFSEFTSKPSALSLCITPLLYGRYNSFNIFVGASLGLARVWNKQDLTSAFYDNSNELVRQYEVLPTYKDVAFGINPTLGVNIPVGRKGKPKAELELAFSMHRWRNSLSEDKNYVNYNFYNLQLTYRFILK